MSLDDVLESLPPQMISHLTALKPVGEDSADENSLSDNINEEEENR